MSLFNELAQIYSANRDYIIKAAQNNLRRGQSPPIGPAERSVFEYDEGPLRARHGRELPGKELIPDYQKRRDEIVNSVRTLGGILSLGLANAADPHFWTGEPLIRPKQQPQAQATPEQIAKSKQQQAKPQQSKPAINPSPWNPLHGIPQFSFLGS